MKPEPSAPLSSVTGLGRLLEYFPYNKTYILPIAFVLGLFMYILASLLLKEMLQLSDSTVCVGGIALSAGAILLLAWHDRRHSWPYGAALYENGFAHHTRNGLVQVRWDQIKSLEHHVDDNGDSFSHRYIVSTHNNDAIVLANTLRGIEDLWTAIETNAVVSLDEHLAAIHSGRAVTFGPFILDAHKLNFQPDKSYRSGPDVTLTVGPVTLDARDLLHKMRGSQKSKFIAWGEFNSLDVRPQRWQHNLNEVVVTRNLPKAHPDHVWACYPEHEIVNLYVLRALCKRLYALAMST
jgi:hypothetical protein